MWHGFMEFLMLKTVKICISLGHFVRYDACFMYVTGKLGYKWCWLEKNEKSSGEIKVLTPSHLVS